MKILVIQQKMIGDVLVCSILCNNLKKAYPNAQIHYMVYESTIPILEGNPNIDEIIPFKKVHRKSKWSFFKFMMKIRREKYDILIDSYSKLESWLTTYLSGAKRKVSYKKSGRNFIYTDLVYMFNDPSTNLGLIIERRLSLLDPLNLDIDLDPIPKLYLTHNEINFAKQSMTKHGIDRSKKTIMISILGSSRNKTYPKKYMSKLVNFIAKVTDANILFNYNPNQLIQAEEIYNACDVETKKSIYFNLLGRNLREYIALINECDLILGNDGGAINMAKALGKPSFIIFSPWIEQHMWANFEDAKFFKSVHLHNYKPELFERKSQKQLKKNSIELYEYFEPAFIINELKSFLNFNLKNENKINLKSIIKNKINLDREKFSVLVITSNEAVNLPSLIRNLNFADELLIIDSFSTDDTIQIMKEHPRVKFIQHKFENFSDQRNFAIQQASNDWVLFVDADERLPKALKSEIQNVLSENTNNVAYEIYRQFYFANTPLKYGGFQTDRVIRLFNRKFAYYNRNKLVHETLNVNGNIAVLKAKLLHYSYVNFETYKQKMTFYAKLRAKELKIKNKNPSILHSNFKPIYRFFYSYIVRKGFLDGKAGYTMAKLNAYGVKQRYSEFKRLN